MLALFNADSRPVAAAGDKESSRTRARRGMPLISILFLYLSAFFGCSRYLGAKRIAPHRTGAAAGCVDPLGICDIGGQRPRRGWRGGEANISVASSVSSGNNVINVKSIGEKL